MAELPSGTVTFLMTDIEGSTKLLERLGDGPYERVLDDHRAVIRAAIARHNGLRSDSACRRSAEVCGSASERLVAPQKLASPWS